MHQVLARKYRPKKFTEVIGQPHIVQALSNALEQNYLHHAYLFTGMHGTGKTTLARILAKCLNCEAGISKEPCEKCQTCQEINSGRFPDLYEVDAASRTKVEDTRELLDNVQYTPTKGRYKVYLIDEVHMLSGHSFNALLKTLEEPPEHVKFLLATTDPQKLPATVLSRCLQFHLSTMPAEQIAKHLETVLQQEKIDFETPGLNLLAHAAQGSMRDALSLLDQSIAYGNGHINTNDIKAMLGSTDSTTLYNILTALSEQNPNALLAASAQLNSQGASFQHALSDLLDLLHQIAILQFIPNHQASSELKTLAEQLSKEDVQLYYQIGLIGQRDLPFAPTARNSFEMTLLRMLAFIPGNSTQKTNTAVKPAKKVSAKKPSATNTNNWHEILASLTLTGAALALAQQISLIEKTDTEYRFKLDSKHQALNQPQYTKRIETALNEKYGGSISVIIEFGDSDVASPAKLEAKQQQGRQRAAESSIMNDQGIKKLVEAFDATVIKDSITPTDNNLN
ncbi:MAG: DNA polymerase III subunit gamma/tau [Gammaproteobacteria bacterium]|nr:DNA polymerase III subunit gamma/tau [Gammaproteobacteria bacterium]